MRTRAQVSAARELLAQHRRDTAAFAAAIAASRRSYALESRAPLGDATNEPSAPSHNPVEATPSTFITPEKKPRKRKRSVSSPSHTTLNPSAEPSDISPASRDLKRRPPPTKSPKATKASMIRRTLDYEEPIEQIPPISRAVLERLASGDAATSSFIGRAEEQLQIERVFVSDANATRALFVIGPPGTGKSTCVAHVAENHPETVVVRVNCSTFQSPTALFDTISEQLVSHNITRKPLPPLDHTSKLESFLASTIHASSSSSSSVLVLDEVDYLVRLPSAALKLKAQHLLKFMVRWAHISNATLRFVGILNGVDMHAQIAEFLAHDPHPTSVVLFPSYSLDELLGILTSYVNTVISTSSTQLHDVVEPRALELIARKVAARDGDARRAVALLRQCARVCLAPSETTTETTPSVRLTVRDVLKCTNAAISSQQSVTKQIQQLPRAPKLLLYAVTRLAPCETMTVSLNDVCDELQRLQSTQVSLAWIPHFRLEELQQHLGSLECYALVKQTAAKSKGAWHAKLTSTVAMDVLLKAFQDDELLIQLPQRE